MIDHPIERAFPVATSTSIPARIYPSKQLDLTLDLSSYTLIGILLNQDFN